MPQVTINRFDNPRTRNRKVAAMIEELGRTPDDPRDLPNFLYSPAYVANQLAEVLGVDVAPVGKYGTAAALALNDLFAAAYESAAGAGPHRYWKIGDCYSYAGYVSAGELWLQSEGVDLGPPVANLASSALDGGSIGAYCYDGSPANRWMTNGAQDGTSAIAFDYGEEVFPDGLRLQAPSADEPGRTIKFGVVYWSDDGLEGPWTPHSDFQFGYSGWGAGEERTVTFDPPVAMTGGKRWWRLANVVCDAGEYHQVGELAFMVDGVALPNPVGTASSQPYSGQTIPRRAYDGATNTIFMLTPGQQGTGWVAYDYGVPVIPDAVRITGSTGDIVSRTIRSGMIQWSDDGEDWTDHAAFAFGGWSDGQVQTFAFDPIA